MKYDIKSDYQLSLLKGIAMGVLLFFVVVILTMRKSTNIASFDLVLAIFLFFCSYFWIKMLQISSKKYICNLFVLLMRNGGGETEAQLKIADNYLSRFSRYTSKSLSKYLRKATKKKLSGYITQCDYIYKVSDYEFRQSLMATLYDIASAETTKDSQLPYLHKIAQRLRVNLDDLVVVEERYEVMVAFNSLSTYMSDASKSIMLDFKNACDAMRGYSTEVNLNLFKELYKIVSEEQILTYQHVFYLRIIAQYIRIRQEDLVEIENKYGATEVEAQWRAQQAKTRTSNFLDRNYYLHVLGLNDGAYASEIKQAYRKLALKYHPDTLPADASAESRLKSAEKFREIKEAYEHLME